MTRTPALGAGLLVLSALPALLTASADTPGAGGHPGWAWVGDSVRTGSTTSSSATSFSSVVNSSTAAGASTAVSIVSCSGDTCSVTLGGDATVQVLGATISILRLEGDRATLRVDGQEVSCSPGRTVSAGAVHLACTEVTADTASVTVTPR
jgi:hypothetical protein